MSQQAKNTESTRVLNQQGRQKVLIFIAGVGILTTMAFYLAAELWESYQLSSSGQQSTASVLQCKRRGKIYRCQIRFKAYKSIYRRWVTPGFFQRFKKGARVKVYWDNHQPHRAKIALFSTRVIFGVVAFLVMLVLFVVWLLRSNKDRGSHPSAPVQSSK
jgi:cytochrome bd-type quinol oxidase subunit 1